MAGVTRFSTYSSPIGGPPNSPATKLFSLMVSNSVSYLFLYVGYLNLTQVFILNKTGTLEIFYCTCTVHVQILTQFYYPHTSSYSYRTKALTVVAQGLGVLRSGVLRSGVLRSGVAGTGFALSGAMYNAVL